MARMADDGVRRLIAIALAPHYSRISIGGYHKAVLDAQARLGNPFDMTLVESWQSGAVVAGITVRAGLAAGPVSSREGDIFGTPVNLAARLVARSPARAIFRNGIHSGNPFPANDISGTHEFGKRRGVSPT